MAQGILVDNCMVGMLSTCVIEMRASLCSTYCLASDILA